ERLLFQRGFVNQTAAHVGIVVSTIERLLEAPVEQVLRRGRAFEALELLQRRRDAAVRQHRPDPVAFEREQALRELIFQHRADEVAAVFAQDINDMASGFHPRALQTTLFTSSLQPSEYVMKPTVYGCSRRKMPAICVGRGLMISRASVSAKAVSQSGTGNWQCRLCVMSG